MTAVSKLVWLAFALCWGAIRYHYGRRARRNRQIEEQDRIYEIALLILSFLGYLGVPVLYLATRWLSFADYPFQPVMFCAGIVASAGSLWLFWRSHVDLGRMFSVWVVIVWQQAWVPTGVCGYV